MKEDRVLKWLLDVQNAIDEIESFVSDQEEVKNSNLLQNVMLKRAIERNIEIIGEAINRILALEPALQITNARRIVDTRNFIIHEYEKISDEVLWAIIIRHLPLLKTEIIGLIGLR